MLYAYLRFKRYFMGVIFQMKRNLLLVTAITFTLSLFLSIFAYTAPVTASAADVTINKVSGYDSYELSYLVTDAGYEYHSDMAITIGGVKVEKPSTTEGGTTEEQQTAQGFRTTDGKKIEFLSKKVYELNVTHDSDTFVIKVDTTKKPAEDSLKYVLDDAAKIEAYEANVKASTEIEEDGVKRPIRVDDDFVVPSVAELVKDEYFDVENLTGTLYYSAPQSSGYSTKSISDIDSVKFDVSEVGTYSFYVLLKNNFVTMSTTDLVEGKGGFYAKDADGNATGDVVIPVFSFTVGASSSPKITVSSNEKAYKNLEYTVKCFNIVASDYNTEYTLYYYEGATPIDSKTITAYDKVSLEELGMKEVTKENGFSDKNLFNSSSKTFTPEKTGYYYVVCHVVDFANEHETKISNAIDANNELVQVKYESQFLKYNWVSIVLLAVAVVCFVAIIVLLCVKPKDNTTLSTKK